MYYNDQLIELQQQVATKKRLDAILNDLENRQRELEKKVRELEVTKDIEEEDVERLEGRSLANFFYSIIGKKGDMLDKERQEAYAAQVKYDAAMKELNAVEEDIKRRRAKLSSLSGCEERYRQMFQEKKAAIKKSNSLEAETIFQLEERIASLENQKKEIQEALRAGATAQQTVSSISVSLNDAKDWSTWDMLGGGLVSDIAKHSHLDDAQYYVEQLQMQLSRFKTELTDVTIYADIKVNIDGFLKFADFCFDGLFTDLTVRNRISDSLDQINNTSGQINKVMKRLEGMYSAAEKEQKKLKANIEEIVMSEK